MARPSREVLVLITQDLGRGSINGNTAGEPGVQMTEYTQNPQGLPPKERPPGTMPSIATKKLILGQGPWCDEELTMAWERVHANGGSMPACVLPTLQQHGKADHRGHPGQDGAATTTGLLLHNLLEFH
jgi:hypothetical protein